MPLIPINGFIWLPTQGSLNLNVRRDVYAAWLVLRDLHSKQKELSKAGATYATTHPSWKALSPTELAAVFKDNTRSYQISLQQLVIRGVQVKELTF